MFNTKLKTFALLFSLAAFGAYAQEQKMAAGEKSFDKFAYVDAIKTYERIAEKGHKSADLFMKLGDAYYFNANLEAASKWYTELFLMNEPVAPEYYYRYAQALKATANYTKADEMMAAFAANSENDSRAKLFTNNKNYLEVIEKNSGRYKVDELDINSKYSDYGPSYLGNSIVFTSSRDTSAVFRKVDRWTNQSFTTLYVSQKQGTEMGEPEKFSKHINSKYHESTAIFTKDGMTMYFTRNNFKSKKDNDGRISLKIFKAIYENGKWSNVTELPFNSNDYSCAHPSLSADEKYLYFASNMPGTLGQSDIFRVFINSDGSYGTPVNLGPGINTEGRESFPFISKYNELYFASDGHPGLGGLDIYISVIEKDASYAKAFNVGKPINSPSDDFALIIDTNQQGYFSSNRDGGIGYDDIYGFTEIKPIETECKQLLAGIITDKETLQGIAGCKVTLYDSDFDPIKAIKADAYGKYAFDVECGEKYYVRAEKEEFATKEASVTIGEASGQTNLSIVLQKVVKKVEVGSDLAKTFNIELIYFDLDKADIRKDAAVDLEKVIDVMKANPTMKIDVRSHTDSRASNSYNLKLSEKRAKATIAYMVKNGIDASRITGKGYGESKPINKCKDGVECTETEHQQNRRSEFIITEL